MEGSEAERRGQWLRGLLDLCVLALLRDGESYGYQLAQALEAAGLGPVQGGTLYPVLLRLQRAGLVTTAWREGEAGPARKYYRLSDDGRRELTEVSAAWLGFADRISGVLKKGDRDE